MPNFLFEIGTEELPADFIASAIAQWQTLIPRSLETDYLTCDRIEVYGTPRRLAVLIHGLPPNQPNREEEIKGPPAPIAFKDDRPTKAAEGFARKQAVSLDALEIRETNKGPFVFVNKIIPGQGTTKILQTLAPQWLEQLEGKRFMRWADGDLRFPRPIRWLVALWDSELLPIELMNGSTVLKSDRTSRGHRILHPDPIELVTATDYPQQLRSAFVEVDPQRRQETIQAQVKTQAQQMGGVAEISEALLEEVTHLVEWPTAVVGNFEAEFLQLPPEVVTTEMVQHQRYFPIKATHKPDSDLLAHFITISNGDPQKSTIIATGNERVIRARLADGQFFYQADCETALADFVPKLATVTFQEGLGSMGDKLERVIKGAQHICQQLELSPVDCELVERTALLCKADLVSQMVIEFPELQGVMGQKYALVSGEPDSVAQGIVEHYLPRGVGDRLPDSLTGQVVGIADRIDTLVSILGLGLMPSGSSDPFALRRAANAVINIIWAAQLPLNLGQLIEQGATEFVTVHPDKTNPLDALKPFFLQRIRTLLQDEQGIDYDLVNAVLGEGDTEYGKRALCDLIDVGDRARFLQTIRDNGQLDAIYETVNRSTKLAVKGPLDFQSFDPVTCVKPDLFEQPSEHDFYGAIAALVPTTQVAQTTGNYQQLVDALAEIAPTVSRFFDGPQSVLVMAKDPKVKTNRLNLLGLLRNHARVLADFGSIVKA